MGKKERRKARQIVHNAREGVVYHGHQGIYDVIDKVRAAAAKLDGAERRKVLFKCSEICKELDAKVEAFVSGVQDPSVEDHAAIFEGVYNLLRDCQPIYHALKSKGSGTEAFDEFNAAEATLARLADEDEAYGEHRRLNGGLVRDTHTGNFVRLNAKDFATWQEKNKKSKRKFEENPYTHTNQTPEAHIKAFSSEQKRQKRKKRRYALQTKEACVEEPPPPKELVMRVTGGKTKKYYVQAHLFQYAPKGMKNRGTTKEAAMELAALCEANRPAGMGREAKQDAHAQKGYPRGVTSEGDGYTARVSPKKKVRVTLAAPGGGCIFASAKAAGEAIEKYEKAGSPTDESDPLVCRVRRT